jgi:hypothetical protein
MIFVHTLNTSPEQILSDLSCQLSVVKKQDLRQQLIDYINFLLLEDFNRLLQLLYRVDVSEQKLKLLLQENPSTDAAILITDLLIARQEEKIKLRTGFSSQDPGNIPEEDKW